MSTTSPPQEVLHALENAQIPASFATFPNLQLHPIPHIPLPSYPDLVLTNYLLTDARCLSELMNHPKVSPGLATTKLMVFDEAAAGARIDRVLGARRGWCFPGTHCAVSAIHLLTAVIRHRQDLSKATPGMVGWLHFGPDARSMLAGPGPKAVALRERVADLPIEEQPWSMGFALRPEYFQQGIMSAAVRFVIDNWFVPTMHPYPGQLSSAYYPSNKASEVIHHKLNFLPVAITKYWAGRELKEDEEECIVAVWQGAGECRYEDSIYSELPTCP